MEINNCNEIKEIRKIMQRMHGKNAMHCLVCLSCNANNQTMSMHYDKIPKLIHDMRIFENVLINVLDNTTDITLRFGIYVDFIILIIFYFNLILINKDCL